MTHAELCARAEGWLRSRRCHVVLVDVRTFATSEQPDAIGWRYGGHTELVECKASRADFLRDREKVFRREPDRGMGYYRWFLAVRGTIAKHELPTGWGLATIASPKRIEVVVQAQPFFVRAWQNEMALLVTALRRATEGWGRRMFGEISPPTIDGDPHPSSGRIIKELREEVASLRRARGEYAPSLAAVTVKP